MWNQINSLAQVEHLLKIVLLQILCIFIRLQAVGPLLSNTSAVSDVGKLDSGPEIAGLQIG